MVADVTGMLHKLRAAGKNIMFEGAQGTFRVFPILPEISRPGLLFQGLDLFGQPPGVKGTSRILLYRPLTG